MNIQTLLTNLGLSELEAKIYLSGVGASSVLASQLAKMAEVSRPSAYLALDSLIKRGLVSSSGHKHGQKYTFEPAHKLKHLIADQEKKVKQMSKDFDRLSVELESQSVYKSRPATIRLYDGKEGIKSVAHDVLATAPGSTILAIVPIESVFKMFSREFLNAWNKEGARLQIKSKTIWSAAQDVPFVSNSYVREMRTMPKGFAIPNTIVMYGEKVAVFSHFDEHHLFAFVIESKEYRASTEALFELLWQQSTPSNL
ncbi:MAG TPA: helix-turn-helix domain-containing protein [Candidatus Paceibacterota bacterium]